MANYNKDTDYTALIEQAVNSGNYAGAALLEQQRNQKIADMKLDYDQTNQYSQYLPNNGTNPNGGSADAVYTYNAGQDGAKGRMNTNSAEWWAAKGMGDTNMMKTLEEANKQLAALLGDGVTFDGSKWSGTASMPATMHAAMNTGVNPVLPTYDYNAWEMENPAPTFDYSAWEKENPSPTFQSAYNAQIDQLMNGLLNRDKFSYDAETDPMFQQYKDIYTREGNRSMNDTLAAAASGAGGMSSYAMTAAQQANNYYMSQLGDKLPELQQLAYEMYMNDLNLQRQDISMLMDKDNTDYGRYRDQVGDWQNDRNFNYGMYRDQVGDWQNDRNFGYNQYRDQMGDYQWGTNFNYGAYRDQVNDEWRNKEWEYGLERDKVDDGRYDSETAYDRAMEMLMQGVMPDSDLLTSAGISQDTAAALKSANMPKATGGSSGGSSGGNGYTGGSSGSSGSSGGSGGSNGFTGGTGGSGGSGWNNGGLTDEQVKAAQKYYGVTADGKWGPKSQEAAGGLSAEEAWLAMSDNTFWGGMVDLGIGPVNAELVAELSEWGGVVENPDGSVSWANGWNASNYQQKLKEAKNKNLGLFLGNNNFLP